MIHKVYTTACGGEEHRVLVTTCHGRRHKAVSPLDCSWEQIRAEWIAAQVAQVQLCGCAKLVRRFTCPSHYLKVSSEPPAVWQATPWVRALLRAVQGTPWLEPNDRHDVIDEYGPAWFAEELLAPLGVTIPDFVRAHRAIPSLLLELHTPVVSLHRGRNKALVLRLQDVAEVEIRWVARRPVPLLADHKSGLAYRDTLQGDALTIVEEGCRVLRQVLVGA